MARTPANHARPPRWGQMALCVLALLCGGCVQRIIAIDSTPTGALVYLNDLEVGRTPMSKEFLWYGDYDVVLRRDGYQTLKTHASVPAPWWQFIPLDLFTEVLPLKDVHSFTFAMQPTPQEPPLAVLNRGEQLAGMLQSSRLPPSKQTRHAVPPPKAHAKPSTRPASGPTTSSTAVR